MIPLKRDGFLFDVASMCLTMCNPAQPNYCVHRNAPSRQRLASILTVMSLVFMCLRYARSTSITRLSLTARTSGDARAIGRTLNRKENKMFDYSPPIQPFVPNWNKQVTVRALPIESIVKKGSAVIV